MYNENDKDNKTYCLMSLWIIRIIKAKTYVFVMYKIAMLFQTGVMSRYKDIFYTSTTFKSLNDIIWKKFNHEVDFCT